MSGKLVGDVLRFAPADLTVAERFVLVALAESARDSDRTSRTNARAIAEGTGLASGTVKNALSELKARALIVPLGIARRGHAQDYRLTQLHAHHRASTNKNHEDPA